MLVNRISVIKQVHDINVYCLTQHACTTWQSFRLPNGLRRNCQLLSVRIQRPQHCPDDPCSEAADVLLGIRLTVKSILKSYRVVLPVSWMPSHGGADGLGSFGIGGELEEDRIP